MKLPPGFVVRWEPWPPYRAVIVRDESPEEVE